MKKNIVLLFVLFFLSASGLFAQWVSIDNNSLPDSKPVVNLIKDDASGAVIRVDLPGFRIKEFRDGNVVYQSIVIGGTAGKISEAGLPDIPHLTKVLAIPDNGTVSVEVVETGKTQVVKGINIAPARESWREGDPEPPYVKNVEAYNSENVYPSQLAKVEDPMVFRDFRIARISIFPIRYSPARQEIEVYSSITVKINYNKGIGLNPKTTPHRPISPCFGKLYKGFIFNYDNVLQRDYKGREDGQELMLCIMPDNFVTTFQPYADWKQKSGTMIHITKFSDIGANSSDPTIIKNFILNAYNTWTTPPTHVLLVGDDGVAPVQYVSYDWTFVNEDYFVELEGNDYFPELLIGRFTNTIASGLQIIVNKDISYERNPYVDNTGWYKRSTVCSNNEYISQVETKRFTAQVMTQYGNFNVDTLMSNGDWYGQGCTMQLSDVLSTINNGISFLNYRGEGWQEGWYANCYTFLVNDVAGLNNGKMMPFVTSIGCGVAMFVSGESFGEKWLEMGTATAPKGACAFLGPTSNTHTEYNNEIDKGIYIGMFEEGIDSPAGALLRGKLYMYEVFGNVYRVEYSYRIFCTLGDPSLHVWKDIPRPVTVDFPAVIPAGNNQTQVTVTNTASGNPVANARICISSDNVYNVAYTDNNGVALIDINDPVPDTLNITVCGETVIPFEGTMQVVEGMTTGWQWVETGYPYTIYDVSFPPGENWIGYAVGSASSSSGVILKTTDGGLTWTKISNDTIPGLRTVCFTTTETGYAGGYQNTLMKTTDGGISWGSKGAEERTGYINNIRFWDSNHGVVIYYPTVLRVTTDGGETWAYAQGIKQTVEDICFADENTLYMVGGDEMISKSTTGGFTWSHIYTGTPFSKLVGVDFYTADYGIAGGENGKMMVTTDGGVSWMTCYAGATGMMHGVNILDEENAFTAGTPEQVYKSTDNGITWVSDFNGANTVELNKLIFTDNQTGIICGSDGKFLINHDYVIPVELTGFTAATDGNNVQLNWTTATETNNAGFEIFRSTEGSSWEKIGYTEGAGTKTTITNYTFRDQQLKPGRYYYRLKQEDYDGSCKYSDKVCASVTAPEKFSLEQNYPNPFNPVTTISFTVAKEVRVNLSVYNVVGEKVRELKNEIMKPGYYQVEFDASKIASGVYFYRLQAGEYTNTRKMNLLK